MNVKTTTHKVLPSRLTHIREIHGMTQSDVAKLLREISRDSTIKFSSTNVLISQWETGKKSVPTKYVSLLCELFGCTKEYLYGFTSDPHSNTGTDVDETVRIEAELLPIPRDNLFMYDRYPVYVVFEDFLYPSDWCILNFRAQKLLMPDIIISMEKLNLSKVKFYPAKPRYVSNASVKGYKKIGLMEAMNLEYVYIIVNTSNELLQKQYNGIYHHNETHTAFINAEGLLLPYEGLNKNYTVYDNNNGK